MQQDGPQRSGQGPRTASSNIASADGTVASMLTSCRTMMSSSARHRVQPRLGDDDPCAGAQRPPVLPHRHVVNPARIFQTTVSPAPIGYRSCIQRSCSGDGADGHVDAFGHAEPEVNRRRRSCPTAAPGSPT